jgi:hypothetical protein
LDHQIYQYSLLTFSQTHGIKKYVDEDSHTYM